MIAKTILPVIGLVSIIATSYASPISTNAPLHKRAPIIFGLWYQSTTPAFGGGLGPGPKSTTFVENGEFEL